MPIRHFAPFIIPCMALSAPAAEPAKKALEPHPVVRSFYVDGVTEAGVVEKITGALRELPSVTQVTELTASSGYVRVAFDTHVIASHLVAQTMRDNGAASVHIAFRIPEYSQNAEKLDALFARIEGQRFVRIEAKDRSAGQFKLTYLPITPDPGDPRKVGFNYGHLGHPVHDPPPKGLGLSFQLQDAPGPGVPATKVKRGKK